MKGVEAMKCAICGNKECYTGKDCTDVREKAEAEYNGTNLRSMEVSAHIEAEHYMKKTRLEELIIYAQKMEYDRLGLAFCIGLAKEAEVVHKILSKDFAVVSVCCKLCGIDKCQFELERLHHNDGIEAICDPIGQAMVLNQEKTDFNILLGLCVGHDSLFFKYAEAPCTVLAVKDRVLGHNPLAAVYNLDSYYRALK